MAAELAEVDRQRRDLVANVSHELRTPISALQATLENLVDGVVAADPELLRTMLAQTERLQRLVTQLLDLSRLESGGITAAPRRASRRPSCSTQVADEAAARTRPTSTFAVDVEPPALAVDGDPERITRCSPTWSRTRRATRPSGGEVRSRPAPPDGRVVSRWSTTGPGIPERDATRVFERFYRADESRATDDGGAGLGLAIARWIVDLHGGRIHAERSGPMAAGWSSSCRSPGGGTETNHDRAPITRSPRSAPGSSRHDNRSPALPARRTETTRPVPVLRATTTAPRRCQHEERRRGHGPPDADRRGRRCKTT